MRGRLLSIFLIFPWLTGVCFASEDIDFIKEQILRPFYYGDLKGPGVVQQAEEYSQQSFARADTHLDNQFNTVVGYTDAAINTTAENIKPTFEEAKKCIDQLALISSIFRPYIEAESKLASREEVERYRRSYLTVDNLNLFTDTILEIQSIHYRCYPYLLAVKDLNRDFLTFAQGLNFNLCDLFNVVTYETLGLVKDIPIRPEYKLDNSFKWPDIEINYAVSSSCPGPNTSGGNPQCVNGAFMSTSGIPYRSKYMQARENVRMAGMLSSAALSSCEACITYLDKNVTFMSGSTSAIALPAVAVLVMEMAISYYEQEERKKEIRDLEKFIDKAEDQIEASFARAISEEQFNEKRSNFCRANQNRFVETINQTVTKINAQDHISQIDEYFSNNDKVVDWYNDVFLFATSGPTGSRLIDDAAKAKVIEKRDALYSTLDNVKAGVYLARSKSQLQTIQSQVGSSCLMGATKSEKIRNFKSAVSQFRSECENLSSLSPLVTDYLLDRSGERTDVKCQYAGFETPDRIGVSANSDGSLNFKVLSGDRVLVNAERASSNSVWGKEFYCSSETFAEFGTAGSKPIKTQTVFLSYPEDVNGLKPSDFAAFKINLKSINDTAKSAVASCARILQLTPSSQPSSSCVQGI